MSIKVLLIDDDPAFRALFRHHITTEWPDAAITEHDPLSEGRLAPEFTAAGYDAVLLDHTLGAESGLDWMKDLSGRPGFPPILYLGPSSEDVDVLPALRAGAEVCISKIKVDHRRFIGALREAARKRKRQLALTRGTQQSLQAYRFGGVTIRGQRFIRAISQGSIASVYLAESERAGAIVVLKVLRKVPDQDEAHGTFDRFLQEYEVVSKVNHPNVVRIYDLGIADALRVALLPRVDVAQLQLGQDHADRRHRPLLLGAHGRFQIFAQPFAQHGSSLPRRRGG